MRDFQFRQLLDLCMNANPWPLDEMNEDVIKGIANCEAEERGYTNWVEAYQEELGGN